MFELQHFLGPSRHFIICYHLFKSSTHHMCHLLCGPIFLIFIILHCSSYIPLSGFHGVISGFLVGIKQIIPDQELPFLKIKVKVWYSNFFFR